MAAREGPWLPIARAVHRTRGSARTGAQDFERNPSVAGAGVDQGAHTVIGQQRWHQNKRVVKARQIVLAPQKGVA